MHDFMQVLVDWLIDINERLRGSDVEGKKDTEYIMSIHY